MQISLWKRFSYSVILTAFVAVAATAYASGPDVRTVQMRDDCDPATFNAAVGPGTCVGDGDTEFDEFLEQVFAEGSAEKWVFKPGKTKAEQGVNAHNRGGEAHTFTPVDEFGGGFVPVLNGGQAPIKECAALDANGQPIFIPGPDIFVPADAANATTVLPGATSDTTPLTRGVQKFQCCIHPWMHTTVEVK